MCAKICLLRKDRKPPCFAKDKLKSNLTKFQHLDLVCIVTCLLLHKMLLKLQLYNIKSTTINYINNKW